MKKSSFSIYRKITVAAACLMVANFSFSQHGTNAWSQIKESEIKGNKTKRYIKPSKYRVMGLDLATLKSKLQYAKLENDAAKSADIIVSIPKPEGGFSNYKIYKNTTMHPDLEAKYPEIRTYNAVNVDNKREIAKLDVTPHGFHAMVFSPDKGTIFIDPYLKGDVDNYQIYYKKDYASTRNFSCDFEIEDHELIKETSNNKSFGSCELRTYRLALACTGEYAQAVGGGTVNGALAAQVTTMNRVNGVYEKEMAITMTIIPNNNLLIFLNPSTDPYTNFSGGIMLGENQSTVNGTIGSANYDIGHVFSTGGGGIAGFGVVCSSSQKARGVTGSANPQGDPFDIDYVAHEMGHQFRGSHSYNNSCSGNRNASTAVEPGSGTTIMAYAGICSPNIKNNSDPAFHGVSMEQIGGFITTTGNTCAARTPISNNAPTITATNLDGNVTIPANNYFALTATATDPDGDPLTYTWEQMDIEISTQPPLATSTNGPNFRALMPSTSPTRYFPRLVLIVNGGPFTWERIPTVSRSMSFRAVVRDNVAAGGCNDHADVTVDIDANTGPLRVTYPNNLGTYWNVGQSTGVAWDVAGTDGAPVNCSKVDIFLSTDNGNSYPIQLADDVDNNGYAPVVAPNNVTATAKVMVIASNGTFFDVSDLPFRIQASTGIDDLTSQQSIQSFYANNMIELSVAKMIPGDYTISVLNSLGQNVLVEQLNISSGEEKASIPFNSSANGIYYISVSSNEEVYNSKFFKN